jgi:hypothetical protein
MKEDLEIRRAEIFRGRQHKLVFLALEEKALMVSEITKKVNLEINRSKEGKTLTLRETSRSLKWLAKRGYSECLNPSSEHGVKGIVYKISKLGVRIKV